MMNFFFFAKVEVLFILYVVTSYSSFFSVTLRAEGRFSAFCQHKSVATNIFSFKRRFCKIAL